MTRLPLTGVRVCDFTWVGAGPIATQILSQFGADVIKVESRRHPDELRNAAPFAQGRPGINRSGYFAGRNSDKRSICVDLKHPRARAIVDRLLARSDVVCNNFSAGVLERMNLGYPQVREVREDIIYVEMPLQGVVGPASTFIGYGLTLAAVCGLMGLTGYADSPPLGTGTNLSDHGANPYHTAFAIIAALRRRRIDGLGRYIEVAQIESTINACLGVAAMQAANARESNLRRVGNRSLSIAPQGVYPCRGEDRWIAVSVETDAQWVNLASVMGMPSLATDARYSTVAARLTHHDDLDAVITRWAVDRTQEDITTSLQAAGIPAGPVRDARDLLECDSQLAYRNHFVRLRHPEMGEVRYSAPGFRLTRSGGGPTRAAPLLGQDTEAVCTELLGYSSKEFNDLRDSGVFE